MAKFFFFAVSRRISERTSCGFCPILPHVSILPTPHCCCDKLQRPRVHGTRACVELVIMYVVLVVVFLNVHFALHHTLLNCCARAHLRNSLATPRTVIDSCSCSSTMVIDASFPPRAQQCIQQVLSLFQEGRQRYRESRNISMRPPSKCPLMATQHDERAPVCCVQ